MKKLILLMLISASCFGQMKKDTTYKGSAGTELIKATKHYYHGSLAVLAGSAIMAIHTPDETNRTFKFCVGGTMALIGCIFVYESHIHFKKAGIIMNKQGIGLTYNLK